MPTAARRHAVTVGPWGVQTHAVVEVDKGSGRCRAGPWRDGARQRSHETDARDPGAAWPRDGLLGVLRPATSAV